MEEVYGKYITIINNILFKNVNIIKYTKLTKLRWTGHLMSMRKYIRNSQQCSSIEKEEREACQSCNRLIM